MPKFEEFKVGDVWIGKEGAEYEILELNPATREALVKIGANGYWCTTVQRLVEWGYRLSNLGLTHKKLDTSKPVRVVNELESTYTVVGKATNGDVILEDKQGYLRHVAENLLENVSDESIVVDATIRIQDISIQTYCTRKGGGWAPIIENGIRIDHLPTGVSVRCDEWRSAHANRALAMKRLHFILDALMQTSADLWDETAIDSLRAQTKETC